MPLLHDELTLWEIGFRWAGVDPDRLSWRIPLSVRDNFRILVDAIFSGSLESSNVSMDKRPPDSDMPPEFFIRHHLREIEDCIEGVRFSRRFLRFVRVERIAIQAWCQRRSIPLPEFWFPRGWNIHYEWPDADEAIVVKPEELVRDETVRLDRRHRIQMACQQLAATLWSREPNLTIKEVACRKEIQDLAGGAEYELETVEGWISKVDPRDPTKKRGRRRKNKSLPRPSDE